MSSKRFVSVGLTIFLLCSMILLSGCAAPASPAAPPIARSNDEGEFNTEDYNKVNEINFRSPLDKPFSTLSIDVDTASYSNVRRFLTNHEAVPQDAVRTEEFINYFKYAYPKPSNDNPIAIYKECAQCPWNSQHKLLLVGLQAKEIPQTEMPPSNLVFLLDVSGSMADENKLPLVKKAFLLLTEQLTEQDRISIVTYAGDDCVVLNGAAGDQKTKIMRAIEDLSAGGSTAGADGIKTAYDIAKKHFIDGGNNRVILATDGDFNVGVSSDAELTRLIEQKRETGIFLSVMGFGEGNLKDNKMEGLADNGNGNYSYIDTVIEAKKVLVEEMGSVLFTVAKDVKIQVEFNPSTVKAYRLIGYENRMLNDEDFDDDQKDAGEMGSGHRVTALFEIIPADSDEEVPGLKTKYQQKNIVPSSEWATVNIRYKEPEGDESKLLTSIADEDCFAASPSPMFQFSSAVAEFGLLLRDSPYKGNASFDRVIDRASPAADDDYKREFLDLVKLAKKNGD